MYSQDTVEVVTYRSDLAAAFKRLNEQWITEYFVLEEADAKVLAHPDSSIVAPGGNILFVIDKMTNDVLGTCALIRRDHELCELAKMAVSPSARGRGLGKLLGEEIISLAGRMHFKKMYLESNSVFRQGLDFLSAASENEWITTLQPEHTFPLLRQANQHLANLLLRHGVIFGAFPDVDAIGIPAHKIENAVADQAVVKHHVSLLHQTQRAKGQ